MIRSLVLFGIRFRRLVVPLAVALVVVAATQIGNLRTDILPEFAPTTVEVQTEALGLSAEEVEQFITVPLEQDLLNGVAFLDTIESVSMPGLSSVVMTFAPGTDPLDARQVVAERLTQAVGAAGLPQVADLPQMLQPLSATRRVSMVSMDSETLSPIEQSVLARWVIVPRLMGVEGVANVSIWGFRDRQLQILVDPTETARMGVDLGDVVRSAGNALEVSGLTFLEASTPGTGGFIDTPNQRLHVFHEQAISSPQELALVPLESDSRDPILADGTALTLGDVAEIVEDHQPLIGDAQCSGGPCVLLVVEKFPEADTPTVTADVEAALEALRPGLGDIQFDTSVYRPADHIEAATSNLRTALLIGAALAIIALVVVDWRTAFVALVTAATSGAIAVLVLLGTGTTINMIILVGFAGAAVFVIVDSVVAARSILYRPGENGRHSSPIPFNRTLIEGALPGRTVALYALIIAISMLLPVYFLDGMAGAFLPHVATGFLLAMASAILAALVVAPAIGMLLSEHTAPIDEAPNVLGILRRFSWPSPDTHRSTRLAIAAFTLPIAAALVVLPTLDVSMQPDIAERDTLIDLTAPPGVSLVAMSDSTDRLASDLRSIPGVEQVTAHVGRAIRSDQVVNVNRAEIWVGMRDDADYTTTLASIEARVADTGLDATISTYSDKRTEALLRESDQFSVRVYGDDPSRLQGAAESVRAAMADVRGIQDARLDLPPTEDTIEIDIDIERATASGIKPGDVRRNAAMLLSGITVGNLFESQKVFDVVVWGKPELRSSVDAVRSLPITLPDGSHIPLGDIASVEVVPAATAILHDSVQNFIPVVASVEGRTLTEVTADVEGAIAQLDLDLGFHAAVQDAGAASAATRNRTLMIAVAAVIGIYLLLQAGFGSWRLATVGLVSLPMAGTGSVIMARISDETFGLGAATGLIATLVVAAYWMVLLIRRLQSRRRSGQAFGPRLVSAGVTDLAVAGAMALTVAALGMVPMATMIGTAGMELAGAMAVSALGGLVTTALLTFVVLPAAYLRWGAKAEPDTEADDLFSVDLRELELTGRS